MSNFLKSIGILTLKNGNQIALFNSCYLDGHILYYQNESFAWKSCRISDIQDFGPLMFNGNFPVAI